MKDDEYRVQVLQTGHMPEAPSCGVRAMQDLGEWEPFCYTMLVARSSRRTVVVNAGFPEDITELVGFFNQIHPRCVLQRDDDERVKAQLGRVGVDPSEVECLILSPIGPYSTGRVDLFTESTICIGRTAWVDFHAPPAGIPSSNPYEIVFPTHILRRLVVEDRSRIRLLEDEDAVCPGIRVFRTGAHHPGSMAVTINTSQGMLIYTDSIFSYSNLENNIPIGWCRSTEEFYQAANRIREEADIFVPAYDPSVFEKYADGVIVE